MNLLKRDIFILLILKELLNDINLCKIISNLIIDTEKPICKRIHKLKYKNTLYSIDLLYPNFLKTGMLIGLEDYYFINNNSNYSIYNIYPLMHVGCFIKWNIEPPKKYKLNIHSKKKYNGVLLVNRLIKKNPQLLTIIHQKCIRFKNGTNKLSVWYDFDNNMFLNF